MKVDKGRLPVLLVAGFCLLVAGCDSTRRSDRADRGSPEPSQPACIDFDNLNVGDNHAVGATIPTSPYQILVEPFGLSGTPATWHVARVQGNNYAAGSGAEINARNVNLTFQLTAQVSQIDMKIAELGGVNNIVVNGTMQNAQDLIDLHTTTVGGAQVTVIASQAGNNWYGTLSVQGAITAFSIGAQELWIDDVCFSP